MKIVKIGEIWLKLQSKFSILREIFAEIRKLDKMESELPLGVFIRGHR